MRLAESLLALSLAAIVCRASRIPVYQRSLTLLELLEHVLMHENEWRFILNEPVKNFDPPPYVDRIPNAIDPTKMNTRVIIQKVVYELSNVKSFVKYAVDILHSSLTCYSLKHLLFQAYYLSRMIDMMAEPGMILIELTNIMQSSNLILDKMCIRPAKLDTLFELYWEAIRLIQFDIIHHVRHQMYPPNSKEKLDNVCIEIRDYLKLNCAKPLLDSQFIYSMEFEMEDLLMDEVFTLTITIENLTKLTQKHDHFVSTYYRGLGFEVLQRHQWGEIFYYAKLTPKPDHLHEINQPIALIPAGVKLSENVLAGKTVV